MFCVFILVGVGVSFFFRLFLLRVLNELASRSSGIPREYFNSIMALEAHRVRRTRFADPMAIASANSH